jgi:CheY-like chemotaxis protein
MKARKCALVVDDSRTAREALGKVLRQHGIRVEMAESAEEALDTLGTARPDVIFMDHLMPGMDGFQAVRAIKDNPATATIPIMMYTSQAGELYVGQARALGAVGVLPKQIKPVQVSATLQSLNLLQPEIEEPVTVADDERVEAGVERTLADVEDMMEPADWGELHGWFARMLEHHGATLRADIENSVARLLKENALEQDPTAEHELPPFAARRSGPLAHVNATTLLVAALFLFAATFFWRYVETQKEWRAVYERNADLQAELRAERERAADAAARAPQLAWRPSALDDGLGRVLPELEWSANQYASYAAAELPLGDRRLELVDGLVRQLRGVGFLGEIQIDSHVGDFCYVRGEDGALRFAPDDLPVAECDRVGLAAEDAREMSAKQSVAFANYMAALEQDDTQGIRISVRALGNSSPLYSYPAQSAENTAAEWNRVARQNNRVQVRLIADAGASSPPSLSTR